jgi:hypothetical protein
MVGLRFRTDDGTTANYRGPWWDVYVLGSQILQRRSSTLRHKGFYFDSLTGLLQRVVYRSGAGGVPVETLIQGWERIEGQAVPLVWTRMENGRVTFSFRRTGVAFTPAATDDRFTGPR